MGSIKPTKRDDSTMLFSYVPDAQVTCTMATDV